MGTLRPASAVLCVGLVACGHASRTSGPQATLNEFRAALDTGDVRAAYALMSDDYRAAHDLASFRKQLTENPAEARSLSEALAHPVQTRTHAQVELATGRRISLESRAGRWLFLTPVIDFYPQSSPRQALASFVHAVERGRWDVVLGLMPDADAVGLTAEALGRNLATQKEELERMVALLRASLDSPIEEVSDRATMPYGESYTARFVREGNHWKIEDPE